MNNNQLTERLLRDGETSKVEFKSSPDALDQIAKSVCAFLNTKGGVVLIGVDDEGSPNGAANAEAAEKLREHLHQAITPQVLFTISLDEVADGNVISVDVPASLERPCVVGGAAFVRRGSRTVAADADTLRDLVKQSSTETERWERRPSTGLDLDDLDLNLLSETVGRAQNSRGYRFDNSNDLAAVLSELSLNYFGQLTNAADVLFGKRVAQRHPQTRVRAVCYETDRSDRFIDEQLFEGPAFQLLDDSMVFLRRHVPVSAEFPEGKLARESKPKYPFNSLREGLVNALVHRDYASFSGSVSVSVYPDRIEIWNMGRLPSGLSPRDLQLASHDSILVNPDIGHVFYLHELMERVGRGTYKIVQECRDFGMRLPEWRNVSSGVRLTLFAAKAGVPITTELNDRQKAVLEALAAGDQIQIREFLDRFGAGVSDRQARRDLAELEAYGFLERHGAGPKTTYERTERTP